ncbi:MAG: Formylglycine-generating sulfatase enzyme [Candidatus Scalindua rubra]|uniref:Formylglycine-generating sulfatase enzyme n=1 Tax=Candidatus Scalindua rubra TaxID=1872076 RepID=A0A1E3X917_9BACT|nr:MAG: Formylglycine-generating sulfatase enzyme [Candidatus Scalindua rubra]
MFRICSINLLCAWFIFSNVYAEQLKPGIARLKAGIENYENGNYDEAIFNLEIALTELSENDKENLWKAHFYLGLSYYLLGEDDEKPVHEVCVDDFYIGKYEVTQGQWKDIMGNNPSYFKKWFKKSDNYPVEWVSWNDVQEFIRKLNRKTGKNYRLPK